MKLLVKLMYVGSAFCGYQAQNDEAAPKPSVQRVLTRAFSECLGFPCAVTGCSRTDAGVHATGFCAAVEPREARGDRWLPIPVGRVHRAMDRFLPPEIAIAGEAAVGDDFHPRYSALGKEYRYRMTDAPWRDPFSARVAWRLPRPLPPDGTDRMNRAAAHLLGTHDFTSFMAAGSKITDATRTLRALEVRREGESITLFAAADGFLYHMVRILVGTLLEVGTGERRAEEMPELLASRDRARAGFTAPAKGLTLWDVEYDPPLSS